MKPLPRLRLLLNGRSLTFTLAGLVALGALFVLLIQSDREQGIRLALRFTARSSFGLFMFAFTASAAERLSSGRFTRWQRKNRRYLGLAFAASHTVHAFFIGALAALYPLAFEEHVQKRGIVGGLVAYVFILLMTATSFERSAAWLGRRAWGALHTLGAYFLWLSFFSAFITRVRGQPQYWLPVVLALCALGLRLARAIVSRLRGRSAQPRQGIS